MISSENDILNLNLPVLPPEASDSPRFDISQPEWLEMLEGMTDLFLSVHPHLLEDRAPVDVRFVMHD